MKKLFATLLPMGFLSLLGLSLTAQATTPPNSLVITVDSSTMATWSTNGGPAQTVTDTSPWDFTINIPNYLVVTGASSEQNVYVDWNVGGGMLDLVNFFQYDDAQNGSTVTIYGCAPANPDRTYPIVANGGTYTFGFPDNYTASLTDAVCDPTPSAPDGGTTVGLLGLGLIGLALLRKRFPRS
jgi:hypothetical protein